MKCVGERPWWPVQNPDSGRKKNVRAKLRGEGDNIKFIDLRFERGQVVGFGKGRRGQDVP